MPVCPLPGIEGDTGGLMWGPVTTSPNTLLVLPWNPQLEPEQQLEPPVGVFPRVTSPDTVTLFPKET